MAYTRDQILNTHKDFKENIKHWEFYIRSYLGGNDYKNGYYLNRYVLETQEEYDKRVKHKPVDNHCRNLIKIYSRFKPDLIIGTGGYSSAIPLLAARLKKIRIIINNCKIA